MRLGARWKSGGTPHSSVPATLHSAIAQQEQLYPEADSWTLTWLEGRPRCALGDSVLVTLDEASQVIVDTEFSQSSDSSAADDDDDWLT